MTVIEGEVVDDDTEAHRIATNQPVPGRLGMLTAMSLVAGAIPIPILPERALRQLRGAIVHEVAARHGLSLSSDAREVLANPSSKDRMRDMLRRGAELFAKRVLRRLGPLGPLSKVARTAEVFALGLLFDRYLHQVRQLTSARILEPEARRIRDAIDASVVRALYPSLEPTPLMLPRGVEDMRDEFTRWIDTFLVTFATLPSWIERRLTAAFDEVVKTSPELGR